jgi:hypothetical protein
MAVNLDNVHAEYRSSKAMDVRARLTKEEIKVPTSAARISM